MSGRIMSQTKISPEIIYEPTDSIDISDVFDYIFELSLTE